MTANLERLGRSTYVLVTTFRKDGTPVSTPVWVGRDGDELIVWTQSAAGKVKRVRNNTTVEVAECDFRGRPKGEAVRGTARILDANGTEHGRRVLKKKYGLTGHVVIGSSKAFRGADHSLCMAISLGQPPAPEPREA